LTDLFYAKSKGYNYAIETTTQLGDTFTQLVWRATTSIGVGVAKDPTGSGDIYMIVLYSPKGNVFGSFTRNVFPPVQ
jgi:hypothetical protein